MGIFGGHLWPYTDLHGLNLDYILQKVGNIDQSITEAQTILAQSQETAAAIAADMAEVRELVETATGAAADCQEALAAANARLDQINARLEMLKYLNGSIIARDAAADPQILNVPVRFGQLYSDTDLSPVETPQTNTLVTWGPLTIMEDVEPLAENVCPVGYYSTDKALLFPVNHPDYYDMAQWHFYYTYNNTEYFEASPSVRYIDYYAGYFITVVFPDKAIAWTGMGPNNTNITDKNLLPVLTGRWVHKSIYYNAGVTFPDIQDIITFALKAERHSYYPQTWQIGRSVSSEDAILLIENFYGSGRINLARKDDTITFAGCIKINNCAPKIQISMGYDLTKTFIIHDAGNYTDVIAISNSKVMINGLAVKDVSNTPANMFRVANADLDIFNVDIKGIAAVFAITAITGNNINISNFKGNADDFITQGSSWSEAKFYNSSFNPILPEITNGQSNIISTAQSGTMFFIPTGQTITFTASSQS